MEFYEWYSLLLAVAFLVLGVFRQKLGGIGQYWKALNFWVAALILYYPVSNFFGVGVYLSIIARPTGFILGLVSLYLLCMALVQDSRNLSEN
jgi:hypothetical protein